MSGWPETPGLDREVKKQVRLLELQERRMTRTREENAADLELEEYHKTLDGALEWFEEVPCDETLINALSTIIVYADDGMIEFDTAIKHGKHVIEKHAKVRDGRL